MKLPLIALVLSTLPVAAQIADNKSLNGKYFFRQLAITTDASGTVTESRTGWGTITFDGLGSISYQGSQMVNATPASSLTGNGSYTVKPGAFATLSNPLRSGVLINARVGTGAVVGSSTESGTTLFDLFIAVPAPSQATSAAILTGPYWVSSFEVPNGATSLIRNTWFKLQSNGNGAFGDAQVTGEAANLGNKLTNLAIPGVTYTVASDGSGTLTLPIPPASDFSGQLIGGVKAIYVSPDGSFFVGGSTTNSVHGLVIGVRAFGGNASNSNFSGLYWSAGIRLDGSRLASYSGAVKATGTGSGVWHRRLRQIEAPIDFTPLIPYNLTGDGSGRALAAKMALASTGDSLVGTGVADTDSSTYEIYFGMRAPAQSAGGVFLNPQGIFNAASFAPAGNPVSPGELITAYGSGLAASTVTAGSYPFPPVLAGVSVTVNGTAAPVYYVSPTQMSFLIPFATKGPIATIVVSNGSTKSNSVDVPVAASSPGIFSLGASGIGAGATLHADYSIVNAANPAKRGETLLLFVTGLGATDPPVPDGAAAPVNPLSWTVGQLNLYIGSTQKLANVVFKGLAPTLAGYYQINFTVPADAPLGTVGMSLQTAEGFTDMVDLAIAP